MTTPAEIARSLTDAQRRWLTGKGSTKRCTKRLEELGLVKRYYDGAWLVLPLGQEVRQILQEQNNADV